MGMILQEIKRCIYLIVLGNESDVTEGWSKLEQLEDDVRNVAKHDDFADILRELLNRHAVNYVVTMTLLNWFSKHLHQRVNERKVLSADVADYLRNVRLQNISELAAFLDVLQRNRPLYLPSRANHTRLCKAIVESLATFSLTADAKQIKEDIDCIIRIEQFLDLICADSKGNDKDSPTIMCLKTLYNVISDTEKRPEPGPALLVLQLIDRPAISMAVNYLFHESNSDWQLAQAFKVLCVWLPKWPRDRLGAWVLEFIKNFEAKRKFSILNQVINDTFEKLLLCLLMPAQRHNADIIFYILKRQGSVKLLDKVADSISAYFLILLKDEQAKDIVQNLVDIINAHTMKFTVKPSLSKLLKESPIQPQQNVFYEIMNGPFWEEEEECEEDNDLELQISNRSNHGKIGLTNLGNTCYMNSVLQALAMTRQFCHEVLNYKPPSEPASQIGLMKKLQNLFALLMYSKRNSWAPTEILHASRPAYFMPGQQQDSSEFLCHLLDALYEQEKSMNVQCGNGASTIDPDSKIEESEVATISECEPMEPLSGIKRWTTEENLTEGVALQRKTQSLADFTQGEDLSQTQNLSDSHSDSTDSGIQSVGGEDTGQASLIHRVFGGETEITHQCIQCATSSHNTDKFRDLQLCFPEEISENHEVSVQDLINYYLSPEKLTGDNKYRCDKCRKLCDAQRIIKILQAPSHLILTLKHFRYDSESRLRTKLRHKVMYNETITLPVCTPSGSVNETYCLYAAVVHSGYSMDYGHYFTYARDAKNDWCKFNDSYVSQTTLSDFTRLEPPDTPYILFYGKSNMEGIYEEDKPAFGDLNKSVQDLVEHDTARYIEELGQQAEKKRSKIPKFSSLLLKEDNNHDDDNPPPSSCRGATDMPHGHFLF